MSLESSGILWLKSTTNGVTRSIQREVEGNTTGVYLFSEAVSNSVPSRSMPELFSDFYGHTQTVSDIYAEDQSLPAINGWRIDSTNKTYTLSAGSSQTLIFTEVGPNVDMEVRFSDNSAIVASDSVTLTLQRRTIDTSNTFTTYNTISAYDTGTDNFQFDCTAYDYKIIIYQGI
jgi:hypothetical protein